MNLCIDIGNTRIKAGFFSSKELVRVDITSSEITPSQVSEWLKEHEVDAVILSSVRNQDSDRIQSLFQNIDVIFADKSLPLPFEISYKTPETLGMDRILGAVGAQSLFPNASTLSVDAGSCITYDIVHENVYLGGAISPGMNMRLKAMHRFTDKLPELKNSYQAVTFGDTTASCMYMGAEQGAIHEFNGFVNQFSRQFPNLKIILTGGDSTFFERHAENAIFAAPNLVLHGLNWTLLEMKRNK